MTELELQEQRRSKWRLDGRPVRTLEDAREFVDSVGLCLMYPLPKAEARVPVLLPTFIGAYVGGEEKLPTWQHAFADPRAKEATELMVRLLRDKSAFEANLFGETNLLVSAAVFPYFYGLVGDRTPKRPPAAGPRSEYSPLARDGFEAIRAQGPISKPRLAEKLGGALSNSALDRALGELWSKLRITRVDYRPGEGALWDVLYRWSPEAVREGVNSSVPAALSALITKYLDCVAAAEPSEVEDFFSYLVPRSRAKEAINALLAARELSFVHIGKKSMVRNTPPREPAPSPEERRLARASRPTIRSFRKNS